MPNHGYCENCWWHNGGVCYMQGVNTNDDSCCPDYVNRHRLNKKWTIDGLLKEWKEKRIMEEEWKIGEIRQVNGEWCQCVEGTYCKDCAYHNEDYDLCDTESQKCLSNKRSDGKEVIFKKLEKVGSPFTSRGKLCQHYKVFDMDNVCGYGFCCVLNYKAKTIAIEIEEKKEDMEEKKLNLKPFDIQKAREGKPVCTRDGRKVRIICFDAKRKNEKSIIALVPSKDYPEFEDLIAYPTNGNYYGGHENDGDLMMLPEKKEGWVNVYKGIDGVTFSKYPYTSKDEAIKETDILFGRIDTIKVSWEE